MTEKEKGKISIDIQEYEDFILTPDNAVESSTGKGTLNIHNTSEHNRLWNVELTIDELTLASNLVKINKKDALEPNVIWNFDYQIPNLLKPILRLEEIIDTSLEDEGINHNFTQNANNFVSIQLLLENTTDNPIEKIELVKDIPDYLHELKVSREDIGKNNLDVSTRKLAWSIDSLGPHETAHLEIKGRTEIKDSADKSGNDIKVDYKSFKVSRTGLVPSIRALTDTMTGIDSEEDDSKPGWWNCVLEFENESEYELTIQSVKVSHKITTGQEVIVDIKPDVIVAPKAEWTHSFSLNSVNVPELSPELVFTPNYSIREQINGHITKTASTFQVIETFVEKNINPATVNANANTQMEFTNSITNKGTASIESIELKDTIPRDFEVPELIDIVAYIANAQGDKIMSVGPENCQLSISPQDKVLQNSHDIKMVYTGLNKEFKPGCQLVVKYPIMARNPQPNVAYETPVLTTSFTTPRGPGYDRATESMPLIGIAYVKRKINTAKSISPSGIKGVFSIKIKIRNKGGVELQNLTVEEIIPAGFTAQEFRPDNLKPEFIEEGSNGNSKIRWHIDILNPGDSLKLDYNCHGVGDFPRYEPSIIVAETESMKGIAARKIAPAPAEAPAPDEEPSVDSGPQIVSDSSQSIGESRQVCPKCQSIKVSTKEDRTNPISYIGGTPIYGKLFYCRSCGQEWK
ncbi:MAG: hypothetical protein ACTSYI_09525 [Promethearchaeota archaeon]